MWTPIRSTAAAWEAGRAHRCAACRRAEALRVSVSLWLIVFCVLYRILCRGRRASDPITRHTIEIHHSLSHKSHPHLVAGARDRFRAAARDDSHAVEFDGRDRFVAHRLDDDDARFAPAVAERRPRELDVFRTDAELDRRPLVHDMHRRAGENRRDEPDTG